MKKSTVTWAILIGLILFSGLAAAAYATISNTIAAGPGASPGGLGSIISAPSPDLDVNMVTLPAFLPVIGGTDVPDIAVILGLLGIIGGAVVTNGIVLFIITRILGGLVSNTKESDDYIQGANQLAKEQTAFVKEMKQVRPPDPIPDHTRPGSLAFSAIVLSMVMLGFFGAAYAASFTDSTNIWNWGYVFAAVGLIAGVLFFTTTRGRTNSVSGDATAALDWGRIWVVLTGLLIVGIGLGVMFFVRSGV